VDQRRGRGYSGADVAGYLEVTNSCMTRMISASLSYSNTLIQACPKGWPRPLSPELLPWIKNPASPLCRQGNRLPLKSRFSIAHGTFFDESCEFDHSARNSRFPAGAIVQSGCPTFSGPCSIRARVQDRPAPASFYELILYGNVSCFIINSIYYRNL